MTTSPPRGTDAAPRASFFPIPCPAPCAVRTPAGPVEAAIAGDGPAVLALHGGMGGCDQSWLLARALLGDTTRFRVIAVSRPGYLGTPLSSAGSPEAQADLCAALLDRLGIPDALVLAVSAGGPGAIQFAARHPGRCSGLILVSACTGTLDIPPEVRSRLPLMGLLARLPFLPALMRRRAGRDPERTAARSIRDPGLRAGTLAHPEAGPLLRELQIGTLTRLAERLSGTLNDIRRFEHLEPLPLAAVRAPVLAVHGTGDRIVPVEHARRVTAAVPGAELLAIPDGEHVSLFTHLDIIRAAAGAFIARRPAQAPGAA